VSASPTCLWDELRAEADLLPLVPLTLSLGARSVSVSALADSVAMVNVLP
jgi:hypothetical protein